MSNEALLKRVQHKLARDRRLETADDFEAGLPLDCAVKTNGGKAAYGFIPQEIAEKSGGKAAPVIVTNELFDHLDVKGGRIGAIEQRGFSGLKEAVEFALNTPKAVAKGNDGSLNIFFAKNSEEEKKSLLYANLMYADEPVSCFVVRSVSPCSKVKDEINFADGKIPSMAVPAGFDDKGLETQIKESYGDRLSGKTWNQGNVMKGLRMHSQEGIYPNTAEMDEFKKWIAGGKLDSLSGGSVGVYVQQALEHSGCEIFFQAAKECGALAKLAPELDKAVDENFLATMKRANNLSPNVKSALVLSQMAAKSENKTAEIEDMSKKYNLTNANTAAVFANNGNRFLKTGKGDIELLWRVTGEITNGFKKPEMFDDVMQMCKAQFPEICQTRDFQDKAAMGSLMIEKAPELKKIIAEKMKTMPKGASKEERVLMQTDAQKSFLQNLEGELQGKNKCYPAVQYAKGNVKE